MKLHVPGRLLRLCAVAVLVCVCADRAEAQLRAILPMTVKPAPAGESGVEVVTTTHPELLPGDRITDVYVDGDGLQTNSPDMLEEAALAKRYTNADGKGTYPLNTIFMSVARPNPGGFQNGFREFKIGTTVLLVSSFSWKDELEFAFIVGTPAGNEFVNRWDDGGTDCARVSFWTPKVPAGYYTVGDLCKLERDYPIGFVMVVVKQLKAGALALPTGYNNHWYDDDGVCSFWQPIAPEGYVAMGTVVMPNHDKPNNEQGICVRKDLVVEGTAADGAYWTDAGSDSSYYSAVYRVVAPTAPAGVAYFNSNSFLATAGNYDRPKNHPSAYLFQMSLPKVQPQQVYPERPKLTSFDKPTPFAEDTVKQTCLMPWFAVKDDQYSAADKIVKSPLYKLERTDRYELQFHTYNDGDSSQTPEITYTSGMSTTEATNWSETTGISVTAGYSSSKVVGAVTGEMSISVSVSQSLTFGGEKSKTATNEVSKTYPLTVQPGTAAAVYTISSTYRLFRDAGNGSEVGGAALTGNQPNSLYYTVYPPRKEPAPAQ